MNLPHYELQITSKSKAPTIRMNTSIAILVTELTIMKKTILIDEVILKRSQWQVLI